MSRWRTWVGNLYLPDGFRPMPVEREEKPPERMTATRRDGTAQDIAATLPGLRRSGPEDDFGVKWTRWPP
jgi:hypothetical protein